ncbi:MAG: hypothetical protein OEQ53_16045 [Saprospiraceae bacterium]|nr:hypothetical protein [Saprospiraceae bacterium]
MARPATRPPTLKDGFYIELHHKNSHGHGIKIHRASKDEIDMAIKQYQKVRRVTFLGEVKNGKFI